MQIPRLKDPLFTDEETKKWSLIGFIMDKIKIDHRRVHELQGYERTIYCLECLSAQINIDGFDNFFDYHVVILYAEIVEALKEIGAKELAQVLEQSKEIAFGDGEIPDHGTPLSKRDELTALEQLAYKSGLFDELQIKLDAYVLRCFDEQGFSLGG